MKITKNTFVRVLSIFIIILLVLNSSSQVYANRELQTITPITESNRYTSNEILVKYKENNELGKKEYSIKSLKKKNLEVQSYIESINLSLVKVPKGKSVRSLVNELKKDPAIEIVQPNYIYKQFSLNSNDSYKDMLWGLDNFGQEVNSVIGMEDADVDAPEAWSKFKGGEVLVAVLDSGVDYTHPELVNKMWDGTDCYDIQGSYMGGCVHGFDVQGMDKDPMVTISNHGTMVSSVIAGEKDNSEGILGINSQVKIMAVKIDLGTIYGSEINTNVTSTFSIVYGIEFASINGAKIINASFGGGPSSDNELDLFLRNSIGDFPGLFVAAAGNNGTNNDTSLTYPCSFDLPNIICVAATDSSDQLSDYSNYGAMTVDLGAPGNNIINPFTVSDTGIYVFSEDFEGVTTPNIPLGWTKLGTNSWGTYDYSPNKVLYGDLNIPYRANTSSKVRTSLYNMSGSKGALLSFFTSCDTEYDLENWNDYMNLSLTYNGIDYNEAVRWDESSLDNDTSEYNHGNSIAGIYSIEIPVSYLTSSFGLELGWLTDYALSGSIGDGCFIDDIQLEKFIPLNGYAFVDGTSFSAPYVSGAASYIWSFNPNLTSAQVRNVLLNSGDSLPSLQGKTVTGKRLNINKALTLAQSTIGGSDGYTYSPITMTTFKDNLYQVMRGSGNTIYTRYTTDGSTWTKWVGNGRSAGIVTMIEFKDKLFQAVRGASDGTIYTRFSTNGSTWSEWIGNGRSLGTISMIEYNDILYQSVRGGDSTIYTRYSTDGLYWSKWIGNGRSQDTVTMIEFNNLLYQAVRGMDNTIYTRYSSDGITWSPWEGNGRSAGVITMIEFNSKLYQAVRGASDGTIYTRNSFDGSTWSGWVGNGRSAGIITMIEFNNILYQAVQGAADGTIYTRSSGDGEDWSNWVGNGRTIDTITMTIYNGKMFQVVRGLSGGVFFRYSIDGGTWNDWLYDL